MEFYHALEARCAEYLRQTEILIKKAKPTDGLMGLIAGPKSDSCHEFFYEDVGELSRKLLESGPSGEELYAFTRLLITAAQEHRDNDLAYWFLYAMQGHAIPLIPLLRSEERAELLAYYNAHYPKIERMPVQKQVAKLLAKK